MRVYHQDLYTLKVDGPCIVMEQIITAGTNPAGPLVKFYFAKVRDLPETVETSKCNRTNFGQYLSNAYVYEDSLIPIGVDGYNFTEIRDWGVHYGVTSGENTFMLPDTPSIRHLIHLILHQEKNTSHWRQVAAGRLNLFTEVLTQVIKSLTIPEPVQKFMEKHFPTKG